MIRRYEVRLYLGLLLLLGGLLTWSVPHTPAASPTPPEGLAAPGQAVSMPGFELPNANGDPVRSAELRGKVVVVRFWASW